MARVTIHIGMPKTGTTTLQHMFAGRHGSNSVFLAPGSPEFPTGRHFCVLATHRAGWPESLHGSEEMRDVLRVHRNSTLDHCRGLEDKRQDAEKRFVAFLEQHPGRIVFSDETLTGWGAEQPICDVLRACGRAFDVLGYIRQIDSTTPAVMQEMIRSSPEAVAELIRRFPEAARLRQFSPAYREIFHPWDDQAGIGNVVIRPYPELVQDGEVTLVRDFSEQIGMQPLRPSPALNQQASAEVTAISYALLHEMVESGFDRDLFDVARSLCAGLGRERLVLSATALQAILGWRASDLEWTQARTGLDLSLRSTSDGLEISSLADLRGLAGDLLDRLASHIEERWGAVAKTADLRTCFAELRSQLVDKQGSLVRLPANFDAGAYLAANPDVAIAQCDPGQHYRLHGFRERRSLALASKG